MAEEKNFYKDIIDNLYDGVYFVDPTASSPTGTRARNGSPVTPLRILSDTPAATTCLTMSPPAEWNSAQSIVHWQR